ncbi:MAG TPA: hypothetical protein VNV41_05795 [Candidatus Acidoferrales bacterium]|nr:hypothetical protein [Candidatus Acidoferrales bacterium]
MKKVLPFIVFVWTLPALGQAQAPQPQMMCRDLKESGGFLYQGETVINGQACRPVSYAPIQQQAVSVAAPAAAPVPSATTAQPSVASTGTAIVSSVVELPDSTLIKLALSNDLSSANATQGQVVEFRVAEDVTIDGAVVVKKGTLALGKVTFAQGKRHLGRAGSLDIEADKTHAVDGTKVELHAEAGAKGKGKAGAMSAGMLITATGVGAPIGALWLLKHGKDATIPAGSVLTAYTDDAVQVRVDASKQIADAH